MAEERFNRFKERLRFEHHAFATTEGTISHGAMAVFGEFTQILNPNLHKTCFASPADNPVVERPVEKLRENRDEVKAHEQMIQLTPPSPILYVWAVPRSAVLR